MEKFLICCLVAVVLRSLTARLSALETALLIVVLSANVIGGRHTTTQNTAVSMHHYDVYIPTSSKASSKNRDVGVPPLSSNAHVGLLLSRPKSSTCPARSNTSPTTSSGLLTGCGSVSASAAVTVMPLYG